MVRIICHFNWPHAQLSCVNFHSHWLADMQHEYAWENGGPKFGYGISSWNYSKINIWCMVFFFDLWFVGAGARRYFKDMQHSQQSFTQRLKAGTFDMNHRVTYVIKRLIRPNFAVKKSWLQIESQLGASVYCWGHGGVGVASMEGSSSFNFDGGPFGSKHQSSSRRRPRLCWVLLWRRASVSSNVDFGASWQQPWYQV